jgi:NAD(P)-dependent dehydrogenase (short-subunit alcohol dehydrogenase family)
MATQDGMGCIINISSGAGHPAGSPTLVSYGATKSGLNQLTRSRAQEWRVNCIALGPTMTENFRSFALPKDDPTGEKYFAAVPLHRAGEPAEVGRVCVFLAAGRPQDHHRPAVAALRLPLDRSRCGRPEYCDSGRISALEPACSMM